GVGRQAVHGGGAPAGQRQQRRTRPRGVRSPESSTRSTLEKTLPHTCHGGGRRHPPEVRRRTNGFLNCRTVNWSGGHVCRGGPPSRVGHFICVRVCLRSAIETSSTGVIAMTLSNGISKRVFGFRRVDNICLLWAGRSDSPRCRGRP